MSEQARRLIAQAQQNQATTLDLGNCGLTDLDQQIPELFELEQLEELILSNKYWNHKIQKRIYSPNKGEPNQIQQIPKGLQKLSKLKKLVMAGNQIQKLENLPDSLHTFDISDNQIQKLENLPDSLHTFYISDNQIQKLENLPDSLHTFYIHSNQIQKLENLPESLHTFDIRSNQIQKLENLPESLHTFDIRSNQIQKLENLPESLHTFDISDNQIQKLENLPESLHTFYIRYNQIQKLENLPESLHTFDISDNQIQKLENLPESLHTFYISDNQIQKLENLPDSLHTFDIRSNQIQKLENLPDSLHTFGISYNQIQKLENLPDSLHTFYIRYNQIQKLENLPDSLHTFDIRSNQIRDLYPLKPFIQKGIPVKWDWAVPNAICVQSNPLETPPIEVVKKGNEAILNYFEQLEKEKGAEDFLFEAKLLVIGEGGAGKTTFARRIKNPHAKMPKASESTHGIHIDQWNFPIQAGDFEGLSHNDTTFFVNLWDFGGQEIYHATHQFFFSEKSLYVLLADTREQKTDFSYWLNTVEQLCGEDSILFILLNKRAQHDWNIDKLGLRSRFGDIMKAVYTIDLSASKDIPALQAEIKNCLKQLDGIGQPLIKSWVDIRTSLAKEKRSAISLDRFKEICAQHGQTNEENLYYISQYFHRIGVFTHYIDEPALMNKVYLNSNHLVHNVYQLLDNDSVKQHKGRLTHAELETVFTRLETRKMIALLEKFGLMYQANPNQYIVPRHLPEVMPYQEWPYTQDGDLLQFRYQFDKYMPKGLMSRLIVALHEYIPNHNWVWHRGVHLRHNGAFAEIVEQYGGTNQFDIRIAGLFKRDLLVIITQAFDKILSDFKKLQTDKSIQCPCEECAASHEPYYHKIADIERALIKKYRQKTPTVECKFSYEAIVISDLLMLIDYESIWTKLKEKSRETALFHKMQELEVTVKRESRRLSHHIDRLEDKLQKQLLQLDQQTQQCHNQILAEIEETKGNLFASTTEQQAFFSKIQTQIEQQANMSTAELREWQNNPVQRKIKVVLPLLFFYYCTEMDVSNIKLPRSWKELKAWFVNEV